MSERHVQLELLDVVSGLLICMAIPAAAAALPGGPIQDGDGHGRPVVCLSVGFAVVDGRAPRRCLATGRSDRRSLWTAVVPDDNESVGPSKIPSSRNALPCQPNGARTPPDQWTNWDLDRMGRQHGRAGLSYTDWTLD